MLGMYDMPQIASANDALWAAVRGALGRGVQSLDRTREFWDIWRDPSLILAQTCGYPYRARLHGSVHIIAVPDYGLTGCAPGYYRSALVVRDNSAIAQITDAAGARFAFNEALSQSGWAAPQHALLQAGVQVGSLVETGAHAASLAAVSRGDADICGVDLHTLNLLTGFGTCPPGLKVIHLTDPTPGLPFICAPGEDVPAIRAALEKARTLPAAAPLGIRALVQIPHVTYMSVPTPPGPDQTGLPLGHLPANQA